MNSPFSTFLLTVYLFLLAKSFLMSSLMQLTEIIVKGTLKI